MDRYLLIPLHAKIAFGTVAVLAVSYFGASVWMARDFDRGLVYVVGGLAKGAILPALLLFAEYRSIFRREQTSTKIAACGWLLLTFVFIGHLVNSVASVGLSALPPFLVLALVPCYLCVSHVLWLRALRANSQM